MSLNSQSKRCVGWLSVGVYDYKGVKIHHHIVSNDEGSYDGGG